MSSRNPPRKYEWINPAKGPADVKWDVESFIKAGKVSLQYEQYDDPAKGNGSGNLNRLDDHWLVERGDSVAALLYDRQEQQVLIVEQFRHPTLFRSGTGWLYELPAAAIKVEEINQCRNEDEIRQLAQKRLRDRLLEETGFRVTGDFTPIAQFYPSPGACSEKIYLYFGEVMASQQAPAEEDKACDFYVEKVPLAEFFAKLRAREYTDSKILIAGFWLKDRLGLEPRSSHIARVEQGIERTVKLTPRKRFWLSKPTTPKQTKIVGIKCGDIESVEGVDVWVNPVSTYFQLDNFDQQTISAKIRWLGATKLEDSVDRDSAADALRQALNGRVCGKLGTVILTQATGGLKEADSVKQICHVAVAKGAANKQNTVELSAVEQSIDNIFANLAHDDRYESVLFPMIGTGQGGLKTGDVAPVIIQKAAKHFDTYPHKKLKAVYLLAYTTLDFADTKASLKADTENFI